MWYLPLCNECPPWTRRCFYCNCLGLTRNFSPCWLLPMKADTVGGKPPLDAEIKKLMADPRINVFLAPLPKSERKAVVDLPVKNKFENDPRKPWSRPDDQKASPQVLQGLQGWHLKTKEGKPLCWHKNFKKGCNNVVKKGRCKFGFHKCMTCLKPGHGAFECKSWLGAEERPSQTMDKVLETSYKFFPWFGSVPTASNPADPPSRMCFDTAILKTGRRINISVPSHLEDVGLASVVLESMDPFVWVTYPNAILRRKNPLSLCSCVSVFFRTLIFETIFFQRNVSVVWRCLRFTKKRSLDFVPLWYVFYGCG